MNADLVPELYANTMLTIGLIVAGAAFVLISAGLKELRSRRSRHSSSR